MLLGAIDVGTNSIHLVVADVDPRYGTSRTVLKDREMVRLGAGDGLATGTLDAAARARGAAAIARFAQSARAAGAVELRAVATSAVREASNGDAFVADVRAAAGIELEVLPEDDEARLIFLGVARGYPLGDRTACVFDIGGGSTEFAVGDAAGPRYLRSVRLGSLRLHERFTRADPTPAALRALDRHVRETLEPVARDLAAHPFDVLIGTSGTVLGLAALDAAAQGAPARGVHGATLSLERLRALARTLARATPAERRRMPGMNPRRSDIIAAGAAIVVAIVETLGRDRIVVCETALREGLVAEALERHVAAARTLGDPRTRRFDEAHALARRFGASEAHDQRVASLALALYDGLGGVPGDDRDALFAAALLHDVGRAISPSAHHKHGAYIVRGAGLPGWSAVEVELVADLVRYHRKSPPRPTHPEWLAAGPAARARIERLAAVLRVAEALDRRHLGVVAGLRVRRPPGEIALELEALGDCGPEVAGARFRADLLERVWGARVTIRASDLAGGEPLSEEPLPLAHGSGYRTADHPPSRGGEEAR